jgi:hypothetical protein
MALVQQAEDNERGEVEEELDFFGNKVFGPFTSLFDKLYFPGTSEGRIIGAEGSAL